KDITRGYTWRDLCEVLYWQIELGKDNLSRVKVNQVLMMFGHRHVSDSGSPVGYIKINMNAKD
ncbi:MAG TPA: hypothetical protein PLM05_08650, partial [Bacteroidales bacterium]|nr:hypothetical protein [Bacteroidales bacterium]